MLKAPDIATGSCHVAAALKSERLAENRHVKIPEFLHLHSVEPPVAGA